MRHRTYGRVTGRSKPVITTGSDVVTATVQTRDAALTVRLEANGDFTVGIHEPEMHAPHRAGRLLLEGNVREQLIPEGR